MKRFVLYLMAAIAGYGAIASKPTPRPADSEQLLPRPLLPRRPFIPPVRPTPIIPRPLLPPTPQPGQDAIINGPTYDGRTIAINLPISQHMENSVGTDNLGLCTFTALEIAARWQYVPELFGFQKHREQFKGGGNPRIMDEAILEFAGPSVQYLQVRTFDEALFDLAIKTGRMPACTYGYSARYGGNVSHMVNAVHSDNEWIVFLDNNFPGNYEWVPRAEGLRRIKLRLFPGGRTDTDGGWFMVLLASTQPPDLKD